MVRMIRPAPSSDTLQAANLLRSLCRARVADSERGSLVVSKCEVPVRRWVLSFPTSVSILSAAYFCHRGCRSFTAALPPF
jgi:hypothetical protein